MMKDDMPTILDRLLNFQISPLHYLLRGVDGLFTLGCRNVAGVHKYKNKPSPITEEEWIDINEA